MENVQRTLQSMKWMAKKRNLFTVFRLLYSHSGSSLNYGPL